VLLTHDLDFGLLLSMARAYGPSVVQARTQDVSPESLGPLLVAALKEHRRLLEAGAIVTIEPLRSRVRVLPIRRQQG
jgi:predicted nuclease of predicted toxin-antitoxin system